MTDKTIQDLKATVQETYTFLEEKTPFTFVDVRSEGGFNPADYSEGEGYEFVHIPFSDFEQNLAEATQKLPRNGKLVMMCQSGRMNKMVTELLMDEPFDILWMEGGLNAWRKFFTTKPVLESDAGSIYQIARPGRGDLSYVVLSDGEAILIDPMRKIELYLDFIREKNAELVAVLDSHNHADRISGGRFIADETGAPYYKHPYDAIHLVDKMPMQAPYHYLKDGDTWTIGQFEIKAVWFPGHTLGMTNFLLTTPEEKQYLFTGDGIFMQSIGRPDLMGEGKPWAKMLYESLHKRLNFITPDTLILPAHFTLFSEMNEDGLYAATYETVKKTNPMMRDMTEEEFTAYVLKDVPVAPPEYLDILRINHALMDVDDAHAEVLEAGKNLCAGTIEVPK